MKSFIYIVLGLLLTGCTTPISPERDDVLLFKARVASQTLNTELALPKGTYDPETGITATPFWTWFDVKLNVQSVLIGHVDNATLTVPLQVHGGFRADKYWIIIHVLMRRLPGDELKMVTWGHERGEFCLHHQAALELGITSELAELYESGRLKCSRWR